MDLKDLLAVTTLLTFLCPGLIFVYIHTVVITGQSPEITKDNIAAFVAVSATYTVAVATTGFFPEALFSKGPELTSATSMQRFDVFVFAFVGPAVLGAVYAAARQRDWPYRAMAAIGLRPLNPSPSAWETAVKRLVQGDYVLATLKDGRTVAGNLDHLSSFSSKEGCTDLILSETTPPLGQNADVTRQTWIASGEVQTLEIVTPRRAIASPGNPDGTNLFFRRSYPSEGLTE